MSLHAFTSHMIHLDMLLRDFFSKKKYFNVLKRLDLFMGVLNVVFHLSDVRQRSTTAK